ncbi:MAG TPA: hypothetical protein ENN78_00895 [Candidatus Omnitrophica bacterium]|nr:hypothetical protein [Candidatus Omnitrophota bacterium]
MVKSVFISLVVLALFISGCATISGRSAKSDFDKQLDVAAFLKFDDVPVPNGFKFIASESFVFQTTDMRVGLLKYQGSVSPEAVVEFYKDQMPLYGWKPVHYIEYDQRMLNFEKESQSAVIKIDGKGNKSFLTISVSPRSASGDIFRK